MMREERAELAVRQMRGSRRHELRMRLPSGEWETLTWVERLQCFSPTEIRECKLFTPEEVYANLGTSDANDGERRRPSHAVPIGPARPRCDHTSEPANEWPEKRSRLVGRLDRNSRSCASVHPQQTVTSCARAPCPEQEATI